MKRGFVDNLESLKSLSAEVLGAVEDGSFYTMPILRRRALVRDIKRLYNRLLSTSNGIELKAVLAATAVLLGTTSCGLFFPDKSGRELVSPSLTAPGWEVSGSDAMSFSAPQANLFGLAYVQNSHPIFTDMDGDGDLDVYQGMSYFNYGLTGISGNFVFQENLGDGSSPSFGFGGNPGAGFYSDANAQHALQTSGAVAYALSYYKRFGVFADLDGDGDQDLVVGEYASGLGGVEPVVIHRNGSATAVPNFGGSYYGVHGAAAYSSFAPAAGDLDGDGDIDILVADDAGDFHFFRSNGFPSFTDMGTGQYSLPNMGGLVAPVLVDVDDDGDLDLVMGDQTAAPTNLRISENVGTRRNPSFSAPTLFVADTFGDYATPTFADIDGDGDLDLFVGDYTGVHFLENTAIP